MQPRRFSVLNLIFVLLLVVGMNHCVFESSLFADDSGRASSGAAPLKQTPCHSHSNEDPGSHAEGQTCSYTAVTVGVQAQISRSDVYNDFNDLIIESLLSDHIRYVQIYGLRTVDVRKVVLDSLDSLSISPNAPPAQA